MHSIFVFPIKNICLHLLTLYKYGSYLRVSRLPYVSISLADLLRLYLVVVMVFDRQSHGEWARAGSNSDRGYIYLNIFFLN